MKTILPRIAKLALLAGLLIGSSSLLLAQDDSSPTPTPSPTPPAQILSRALSAVVDYGNDNLFTPVKESTDFSLLGLDPAQSVNVTVTFPADLAGQSILVEPLDGGLVIVPDGGFVLDADGSVAFQFHASSIAGNCRINVHQADDANFVHFWIIDQSDPADNPSNLPGIY